MRAINEEWAERAVAFHTEFPVSGDHDHPRVVGIKALDKWMRDHGAYYHKGMALSTQRSKARERINSLVARPDWADFSDISPFQIVVGTIASTYLVIPTEQRFKRDVGTLPDRLGQRVITHHKQLKILRESTMGHEIPPLLRMFMVDTEQRLEDFAADVARTLQRLSRDVRRIDRDIAELLGTPPALGGPAAE